MIFVIDMVVGKAIENFLSFQGETIFKIVEVDMEMGCSG